MAAFQQLVKLLPAVAGGELLKIDGGGAVGDVGNTRERVLVSIQRTVLQLIYQIVTTFVPRWYTIGVDPAPRPRPSRPCRRALGGKDEITIY